MYSISFQDDISMMPRERLMREGAEKLSNQELLSIFLRTGNKKETVFQVSQRILSSISSLNDLKHLTLQELQTISGIGPIKAVELQAIIELGRRINRAEVLQKEQIMGSQKLAQKMQQELGDMRQECLVAIYLNSQNQILHQQTIFMGTVSRSIAEPREILHYALKHLATSIILVHNHPSGSVVPSRNDDEVTQHMKEACEMMGLVLLDHLIVSKSNYYSYREETDMI